MLTFFRRIRKGLLGEGQARNYLLYAIGEIALVVIGILIALQINNWNESRKQQKQEFYLLLQMQKEFQADSVLLDRFTFLTQKKVREGKLVRNVLYGNGKMSIDSIVVFSFLNGKTVLFDGYTPTFDEIVSSGKLGILKGDKLKEKIKAYKNMILQHQSFTYYESQNRKETYNTHLFKFFEAEIMTYIWQNRTAGPIHLEGLDKFNCNIDGFIEDPETLNQINTIIGVDSELALNYELNYKRGIRDILNELRIEIDKFKGQYK